MHTWTIIIMYLLVKFIEYVGFKTVSCNTHPAWTLKQHEDVDYNTGLLNCDAGLDLLRNQF